MTYVETLLLVVHLIVAAAVCGFVLMQHGKGADMGAAFGSGSSGSLFGAAGSANFLSRTTAILAALFFLTSVGLTFFGTMKGRPAGVMEQQGVMERLAPSPKAPEAPKAADVPKPADVPQPSGAAPASSVPQPAQNTGSPAAAPAPGGTEKSGEVPK
jgi:preprotein translocase subunit SecG